MIKIEKIYKKWVVEILFKIKGQRFGEIKKEIPRITPKVLSLKLKELEKAKLIKKKINTSQFPIKCNYFLTKKGEDFIKIIKK